MTCHLAQESGGRIFGGIRPKPEIDPTGVYDNFVFSVGLAGRGKRKFARELGKGIKGIGIGGHGRRLPHGQPYGKDVQCNISLLPAYPKPLEADWQTRLPTA